MKSLNSRNKFTPSMLTSFSGGDGTGAEELPKNNSHTKGQKNKNPTRRINSSRRNRLTHKLLKTNFEKLGLGNSAIKLINAFTNNKESPSSHSPRGQLNRSRTNRLRELLNRNRKNINGTRKRKVLELTCPNSNLCLTFNEYYQLMLKEYFKNFLGFHYLDEAIVLSKHSVNGMTTLLKYDRNGYKSDIIMKNITDKTSFSGADNLMYEAFVGLNCVNKYNKLYPVFVETYGSGFLKNDEVHTNLIGAREKSRIEMNKNMFDILNHNKRGIDLTSFLSQYMTEQTNKQVLFVQTVANGITLREFIGEINKKVRQIISGYRYSLRNSENLINKNKEVFILLYELCVILYQIYHALYNLNNIFTHNDLHWENVLIYKLPKNKNDNQLSIQYNYEGYKHRKKISIANMKTSRVAKIIDYGRCFTNESEKFINTALSDSYRYAKIEFYAKSNSEAERIIDFIEYKLEQLNLPFDIMSSRKQNNIFFYYIKFNGNKDDFLINMEDLQQKYHIDNLGYAELVITSYRYKIRKFPFKLMYIYSIIDKNPINIELYNEIKVRLGLRDYKQVNKNNGFISTTIYNGTKDLWCLGIVQNSLMRIQKEYQLNVLTDKYGNVYDDLDNAYRGINGLLYDMLQYEVCFNISNFGSKYQRYSGKNEGKINNVHDAYDILLKIINNKDYSYLYYEYTKDKTEVYANIDVFEFGTPIKVTIA